MRDRGGDRNGCRLRSRVSCTYQGGSIGEETDRRETIENGDLA